MSPPPPLLFSKLVVCQVGSSHHPDLSAGGGCDGSPPVLSSGEGWRVLAYLSACFLLLHLFAQRQSAEVALALALLDRQRRDTKMEGLSGTLETAQGSREGRRVPRRWRRAAEVFLLSQLRRVQPSRLTSRLEMFAAACDVGGVIFDGHLVRGCSVLLRVHSSCRPSFLALCWVHRRSGVSG